MAAILSLAREAVIGAGAYASAAWVLKSPVELAASAAFGATSHTVEVLLAGGHPLDGSNGCCSSTIKLVRLAIAVFAGFAAGCAVFAYLGVQMTLPNVALLALMSGGTEKFIRVFSWYLTAW